MPQARDSAAGEVAVGGESSPVDPAGDCSPAAAFPQKAQYLVLLHLGLRCGRATVAGVLCGQWHGR